MAYLKVIKGQYPVETIPIEGPLVTLGREVICTISIPNDAISRKHARITQESNRYYLEDLESRNHTFLNNHKLNTKTLLKNNDTIRIGEFVFTFIDPANGFDSKDHENNDESETHTTIHATLPQSSSLNLEQQPADKLRHFLEISSDLSKTLKLDQLLPRILENILRLFPIADRAFIIDVFESDNPGGYEFRTRFIKGRRPSHENTVTFSRNIIRQCVSSGDSFLSDDALRDSRVQMSQSVVNFGIRSVMCVPLMGADGIPFGIIQMDTQGTKKFTRQDLELLKGVANQASIAIENARMYEESVKTERLRRDLANAREVQDSFLPRRLPSVSGYEFKGYYKPAQAIGGDYYSFIEIKGGKIAIAVGDVAGKGIPAALLMAKLSSETRYCLSNQDDLAIAVGLLNTILYDTISIGDRFITLVVAVLDPSTHQITMVNAGHPSPLLFSPGKEAPREIISRNATGFVLGMMEDSTYEITQSILQPGESILMFSDGVPEAENLENKHFEMKGINRSLQGLAVPRAPLLVDKLAEAVEIHSRGRDPHDDVTIVSFGRLS